MKRKVVSMLLCSALVISMLAGCGSDRSTADDTSTANEETADSEEPVELTLLFIGDHSIDGIEAVVAAAEEAVKNAKTEEEIINAEANGTSSGLNSSKAVNTGDSANVMLLLLEILLSVIVIAVSIIRIREKSMSNKGY